MQSVLRCVFWTLSLSVGPVLATNVFAQETEEVETEEVVEQEVVEASEIITPLDEEGRLVSFERDIVPILRARCLECHGPEDAKNDFRVDDRDLMLEYIEPEDVEYSTLYVDYLTIDDEDMLMPPKSHGGPLGAGELALIRVWIEEGANWPEEFEFPADGGQQAEATPPPAPQPQSLGDRIWMAQGFLHPATVHFPIALLTVGALFVVLGWKWPSIGTQVPLACLLLGAVSAVVATLMGWAFAPEQGYGGGWSSFDWDREIDMHRWSGVVVSIASCVVALIALIAIWKDSESLTKFWKIGLLLCAGMVGAVGHQGGEMSFGADFYPKAWRILTGQSETPPEVDIESSEEAETASEAAAMLEPTGNANS
jgi:hypothetical protein